MKHIKEWKWKSHHRSSSPQQTHLMRTLAVSLAIVGQRSTQAYVTELWFISNPFLCKNRSAASTALSSSISCEYQTLEANQSSRSQNISDCWCQCLSLTLTHLIHRSIPDAFSTPRNADPMYFRDLFLTSVLQLLLWFNCVPDVWHENVMIKVYKELKAQTHLWGSAESLLFSALCKKHFAQHPFSQEVQGWANLQIQFKRLSQSSLEFYAFHFRFVQQIHKDKSDT